MLNRQSTVSTTIAGLKLNHDVIICLISLKHNAVRKACFSPYTEEETKAQ